MTSALSSTFETLSVKDSYKYKPIDAARGFRILSLLPGVFSDVVQCRLSQVSLAENPRYETISYTWGDPTDTLPVECEGKEIQITKNLHEALQYLRYEDRERLLWADAVCIDQSNLDERSQQVQLMGDIYSQGEQLIVWLGSEAEEGKQAIEGLEKLHVYFLENEAGYPDDQPDRYNLLPSGHSPNYAYLLSIENEWLPPLVQLARRPWLLRRWVIQEIGKSKSALVVWGHSQITWKTLADVIWSLYQAHLFVEATQVEDCEVPMAGLHSIILIELVRRDLDSTNGSPLLPFIISTRYFKCSDQRDVLFSLLGLASDLESYGDSIVPDYDAPIAEIYKRFAIGNLINKKTLLHLSAAYVRPEEPKLNLPSWVPDLSDLDLGNPLMFLRNESNLPFRTTRDTKPRVRLSENDSVLHVWGKKIDVVKDITGTLMDIPEPEVKGDTPAETSAVSNERLKTWLEDCQRVACIHPEGNSEPISPARFEEFARTIVCNLTGRGDLPPPDFSQDFQMYIDVLTDVDAALAKHSDPENPQAWLDKIIAVEMAINLRIVGWRFCNTKQGRLGRVLNKVKEGDLVCVFYGGEVPYILRPCGGKYTFMGSCYMHGLMSGEALDIEGLEEEEFAIC